jgi:diamine N-acetyltransferase
MDVSIRKITADNFIEAIRLKVKKEQENFVASNAASIAQSKFHTYLECYGIYEGESMVGFSACGKNPEDGTAWIVRHMIAEQYQGQGYGKAGLQALIIHMQTKYQCQTIYLDVAPENQVAINLYQNAGFKDTGRIQGHSRVFELTLV